MSVRKLHSWRNKFSYLLLSIPELTVRVVVSFLFQEFDCIITFKIYNYWNISDHHHVLYYLYTTNTSFYIVFTQNQHGHSLTTLENYKYNNGIALLRQPLGPIHIDQIHHPHIPHEKHNRHDHKPNKTPQLHRTFRNLQNPIKYPPRSSSKPSRTKRHMIVFTRLFLAPSWPACIRGISSLTRPPRQL